MAVDPSYPLSPDYAFAGFCDACDLHFVTSQLFSIRSELSDRLYVDVPNALRLVEPIATIWNATRSSVDILETAETRGAL